MALVKIEDVIAHLDHDIKRAFDDVIANLMPDTEIDRYELYRAFLRAVRRKCSTWETVNDNYVQKRCRHCGENT